MQGINEKPMMDKKETQFDEMSRAVFTELNQLDESVRRLSAKISPVLKPTETCEKGPMGENCPPMSSLESLVTDVKNRICAVRHDIYDLNDRITL